MPDFTFVLLHVEDHAASAAFYSALLGVPIVEQKQDFSAVPLREGVLLGLWARDTVAPESSRRSGASEVAFAVADAAAVETMHAGWKARGITLLQAPTRMSFGLTFVAADPDGHRLRVFAPASA